MNKDKLTLLQQAPTVEEFIRLRESVGWGGCDALMAQKSLDNSLYHVLIRHEGRLIAMGRVIGDGAMYFYIQDVVVAPEHQGQGLGAAIMDSIESFLCDAAKTGATIGLLAAKGKEDFYGRYGYRPRSGAELGLGMCKFV